MNINTKPYNIKRRLCDLDRSQKDLLLELRRRDYKIAQTELSSMISGACIQPKAEMILEAADKILKEWENAQNERPEQLDIALRAGIQ